MISLKTRLIQLNSFLSTQVGVSVIRLIFFPTRLPSFFADLISFRKQYKGKISLMPCLHDKNKESGATGSEYFWQDLFTAQLIFKDNPRSHLDIASRVDGFVAHIASFRTCHVVDIRRNDSNIPGINFVQADLMNIHDLRVKFKDVQYQSISCLHALEHFGLGRYGDSLNANGYKVAFKNIASLLTHNGLLYLSVPVGAERVNFNGNWIFNPLTIMAMADSIGLHLELLYEINPQLGATLLKNDPHSLNALANKYYTLCLFVFKKG